ncbi:hypothetical protein JTB14_027464 [Gonioctena quinquepunctata]|nr:hypothetical protein JTB14_027464 [Gonioctena quinquepunctata]
MSVVRVVFLVGLGLFANAALRTVNISKCCKYNEYLTIGNKTCVQNDSSSWDLDIYNGRMGRFDKHTVLPSHWHVQEGAMPKCANPKQLIFQGRNNIPFMNGSVFSLEFNNLFHPSQLCIDYHAALVCLNEPENLTYIKKCCGENAIFSQTNSTCRHLKDPSYRIDLGQNQTLSAGFPACRDNKIHVVGAVNKSNIFSDGSVLVQNNTILPAANFCLEHVLEQTGRFASLITCPEYIPQPVSIVDPQKTEIRFYLCSFGLALSAIFLAATLAAGSLLPASHHVLHWRCQTNHVCCLFVGDVLLCIAQLSSKMDYVPCFVIGKYSPVRTALH